MDAQGLSPGSQILVHQKPQTGGAVSHNPPTGVWCFLLVSEHSQKCSPVGMARLPDPTSVPAPSGPPAHLQSICPPVVSRNVQKSVSATPA